MRPALHHRVQQKRSKFVAMLSALVALTGVALAGLLALGGWVLSTPTSTYSSSTHVAYKRYGPANASRTVVIIPGLDGATSFFADVIPELFAASSGNNDGLQVIVFHLPLFDGRASYTFEFLSSSLAAILDEAMQIPDAKVDIVGESFGGVIAQYFATMFPDRVASLCLLSSLAKTRLPPEVQWKLDNLLPIVKKLGSLAPALAQSMFARLHVDDVIEPHESQLVKDLFVKEASAAHFASVMARIGIVSVLDQEQRARTISAPTLIVYGRDDHFTKEASLRLHELVPGSELRALEGGHLPHVSDPKGFAKLIVEFSSRVAIH